MDENIPMSSDFHSLLRNECGGVVGVNDALSKVLSWICFAGDDTQERNDNDRKEIGRKINSFSNKGINSGDQKKCMMIVKRSV